MNSKLVYIFVLALLAAVSIFFINRSISAGEPNDIFMSSKEREHQEFIFLLQYIGRDYQNAVEDGAVISEFEYSEIAAFSQRALELYMTIQPNIRQNFALFQLQQLRQMVYEKVDRYSILDLTKTLIGDLTKELDIETSPETTPDPERGRLLYVSGGCGGCHGASGAGDGRAAEWLSPGPSSFRGQAEMNEATPYRFFNATLLGVTGTGMPSYEQSFSRQEAWDVAFYLMTLRDGFNPHLAGGKPNVTLEDLATQSDNDLLSEIKDRQPPERANEAQGKSLSAAIDFLRSHPDAAQ